MSDFAGWDLEPTPDAPRGGEQGVGDSPYPLGGADVAPRAPNGDGDHVGVSPFSRDAWDTDPEPDTDDHDGNMELHRGEPTKPLSG